MANNDYRFTLQAQDNASKTVKEVGEAFKETGKSAKSNLDEISKKFDKIQNSTAPVKKKLAELQKLMVQMNYEGLDSSPMFTKMAMEAGSYKDAIADAAAQVRILSTDHLYLDTAAEGLKTITGLAQTAAGAYTLLGGSEADAQKMTAKLVAIQSVYNGIQTVTNALNKDGNLIQGIKAIQTRLATTAINAQTAATGKATLAQKAFNLVAKANPYMLLAGAAVTLGGALLAIAGNSEKAKQKESELQRQEEANRKTFERNQQILNAYYSGYGKTLSDMLIKYRSLQAEWGKLKTTNEKNKWISDNKKLFDELGISVNSVADAERNLVSETKNVIAAFQLQAQAKALQNQIQAIYDSAFDPQHIAEIQNNAMNEATKRATETAKSQPHNEMAFSRALQAELAKMPSTQQILDNQMKVAEQQAGPLFQRLQAIYDKMPKTSNNTTTTTTTNNTPVTPEQKANTGITSAEESYKQRIQQLADMYAKGILKKNEVDDETLKAENDYINAVIKQASILGGVDKLTQEQQTSLSVHIAAMNALSETLKKRDDEEKKRIKEAEEEEKTLKERKRLQEQLNDALKRTPSSNIASSDKYTGMSNTKSKYAGEFDSVAREFDRIQDLITDGIAKGLDVSQAQAQLVSLGKELDSLAEKAKLKITAEGVQDVLTGLSGVTSYLNNIATFGDQWDRISEQASGLSEVFQKLTLVIQVVSGAFETFNTVMELVNLITGLVRASTVETAAAETASATATTAKATAAGAAAATTVALTSAAKEEESAMLGAAAASIYAAHAYIPFAGVGIASGFVATMMAEMLAMKAAAKGLSAFANGGIVSGGSMHGDNVLIRANSGEMILNTRQQKRLFDFLDGNGSYGTSNQPNNVVFKLHGKELVGLISNYTTSKNKII